MPGLKGIREDHWNWNLILRSSSLSDITAAGTLQDVCVFVCSDLNLSPHKPSRACCREASPRFMVLMLCLTDTNHSAKLNFGLIRSYRLYWLCSTVSYMQSKWVKHSVHLKAKTTYWVDRCLEIKPPFKYVTVHITQRPKAPRLSASWYNRGQEISVDILTFLQKSTQTSLLKYRTYMKPGVRRVFTHVTLVYVNLLHVDVTYVNLVVQHN